MEKTMDTGDSVGTTIRCSFLFSLLAKVQGMGPQVVSVVRSGTCTSYSKSREHDSTPES